MSNKNTAKLNQIIAVEKGVKSQATSILTQLHHVNQKPDLFNGLHKSYESKDAEGDTMPSESKRVQYMVPEVIREVERSISDLLSVTARKDWTNCEAKANVVVDGITLVEKAPITYLLFLEKQVVDIRTFVNNLPILDPAEKWTKDPNSGLFKSEVIKRTKTVKEETPIVLYDATEHHPAQTQMITKDRVVGYWSEVKQSGAIPFTEKKQIMERVEKLVRAIKEAREEANTIEEVASPNVGESIFNYLLPAETKEGK